MKTQKVLVIGIDGATFKIIDPLVKEGRLANFKRLIEQGVSGPLQSSIPPLSPVAWTSFMTGVNSCKHHIFDFSGKRKGQYEFELNTARDRTAPPFWMTLGQADRRALVIGVTLTYPPDPVNGYMISGLGAPTDSDADSFTHPPEFASEITRNLGPYKTVPDGNMRKLSASDKEKEKFLSGIVEQIEYRVRLFRYIWQKGKFDFSMLFFLDTDGVSHYFWKYMDRDHKHYAPGQYSQAIYKVYEEVDKAIGEILTVIGNEADVMIVSDHGFGPLNRVVFLNNWLQSKGYLQFRHVPSIKRRISKLISVMKRQRVSRMREINWLETKAYFSGTTSHVFINLKGREPEGIVDRTEYKDLCHELKMELTDIEDPETGEKIVDRVYTANELFKNNQIDCAPDLIFTLKSGYDVVGEQVSLHNLKDTGKIITDSNNWSGTHEPDGIFIAYGRHFRKGHRVEGARIIDIAPTLLYLFGVPIPEMMDGKLLRDVFTDDFLQSQPVVYGKEDETISHSTNETAEGYQQRESDEVLKRLRNLGYID